MNARFLLRQAFARITTVTKYYDRMKIDAPDHDNVSRDQARQAGRQAGQTGRQAGQTGLEVQELRACSVERAGFVLPHPTPTTT